MADTPDTGVLTTQSESDMVPAPNGPVERFMDPIVNKGIDVLAPDAYKARLKTAYGKNRMLYNLGLIGLFGIGGAAAYGGIRHAFNQDDDYAFDPAAQRWRPRSSGSAIGSGISSALGFLAPMALLAGGAYLWNKHGDKIMGKFRNLKNAAASAEKWQKREQNVRRKIGQLPGGNWAIKQVENWMDN